MKPYYEENFTSLVLMIQSMFATLVATAATVRLANVVDVVSKFTVARLLIVTAVVAALVFAATLRLSILYLCLATGIPLAILFFIGKKKQTKTSKQEQTNKKSLTRTKDSQVLSCPPLAPVNFVTFFL